MPSFTATMLNGPYRVQARDCQVSAVLTNKVPTGPYRGAGLGEIEILRYVAVDDEERILNYYLVEAQMHGALAQGIGQALFEEVLYDEYGQNLASTLMDYAQPSPAQIPTFTLDIAEKRKDI